MGGRRPKRGRRVGWLLAVVVVSAAVAASWWLAAGPEPTWREIVAASRAGRWAQTEAMLGRWLRSKPDDGEASVMLASATKAQGRPADALQALERVKSSSRAWARAQAAIGEIAFARHDAAAAGRAFRNAAGRDPAAVVPRQRLVFLASLEQRPAEARDALWGLYRVTNDPRLLVDLVLALGTPEPDLRGLEPQLLPFLDRTPDDPWLRRVLGLLRLQQGRPLEALPHLEAAASALEDDLEGRFALVQCRATLGLPDTDTDPGPLGPEPKRPADRARWCLLKARLAEAQGRPADARADLTRAIEIDPDHREAHFRLAQLLRQSGDAAGAGLHERSVEAIVERDRVSRREHASAKAKGFDADVCARLGNLCRAAGLTAEARAWYEQASRLDPSRPNFRLLAEQIPDDPESSPRAPARPVLAVSRHAEVASATEMHAVRPTPIPRFEDVARTSGVDFRYDPGAGRSLSIADTIGGGVGLVDYDRDGRLDLYFVNGCRLPVDPSSPPRPNRLYRNRPDGAFEDVTVRAGVAGFGYGMGCAVGDYDGDGRDDLFVTGVGRTVLYRNRDDGTFEDVTTRAGVGSSRWTTAAGFADLDGDRDLDLVVITYVVLDPRREPVCRDELGTPIHCSPSQYAAETDHLFRNNGDGTFTDVSREAGLDVADGRGLGLAIADLDGDDRLDLFVANDTSPNFLFRNLGGLKFEEVGLLSGVACDGSGRATASMGVVADDLNGDGRIDLFHTNLVNEGSTLRWNLGAGMFMDATLAAGLAAPSKPKTGFGTAALDADNDGHLDLFVANGHIDDRPKIDTPMAQTPQLFVGRDQGRFTPTADGVGPYFATPVVGRGAAAGDLDNDGRVDLVVVHRDGPASVLLNRSRGGHWLGFRLTGKSSARTPVGARVTVQAGGRSRVRWQTAGAGYLSAHDPRIWFGLGTATKAERVEIRWPSGLVQSWSHVAVDRVVEIEEGDELKR